MTRRSLLYGMSAGAAGMSACMPKGSPDTAATLRAIAERQGLVTVTSSQHAGEPEAVAVNGEDAGSLRVPKKPFWLSVAADGAWLAWTSRDDQPWPVGTERPVVYFSDNLHSMRSVRFQGRFAGRLSISSGAERLALIVASDAVLNRLIVLRRATAEIEHDVTDLIRGFSLTEVERLQISGNGNRLAVGSRQTAVGSRQSFLVVDLPSHKVMLQGFGRFPSLCPDGEAVAFVDRRNLVVSSLANGSTRILRNRGCMAYGVGAWSPDSRFFLAGVRALLSLSVSLVAVDQVKDDFVEVKRLEEGDFGENCVWIKRSLLTSVQAGSPSSIRGHQGRTRPSRNFETAGRPTVLSRYASGTSRGGRRSAPPYYAARQCPSGCVYNGCIAARLPETALGTRRWQPVAVTGLLPHDQSCAHRGCAGSRLLHGEYFSARARAILAILEHGSESDGAFVAESLLLLPGGGVVRVPGDGVRGETTRCGLAWWNARKISNGRARARTWAG